MAEFKSLVPAASLYVNALQQHGQNIMQAGQMIGQARQRRSLRDFQREQLEAQQDRFRQELDMQKSNQRMDSAFKRYQVMSKIDPIIAAEDFFGSTAEDFDGNVMERLNVGKERYADFTKDMNAITKMYMDAESKGTQFNRETKEALNVGFNTLFSKYPRRQEEIAKNIENLGKISETLFPDDTLELEGRKLDIRERELEQRERLSEASIDVRLKELAVRNKKIDKDLRALNQSGILGKGTAKQWADNLIEEEITNEEAWELFPSIRNKLTSEADQRLLATEWIVRFGVPTVDAPTRAFPLIREESSESVKTGESELPEGLTEDIIKIYTDQGKTREWVIEQYKLKQRAE
jgi:hypothetical protein